MVAVAGDDGMPRARNGIIAPPVAALFAASGPATPSIRPVPNSSGCFDRRFSMAYETNVEMMWAAPGRMPIRKPTTEPRRIGPTERVQSSRVGRSAESFGLMTSRITFCSTFTRISATPNRPIATARKLTPSPSSTRPCVNRAKPERWSMPTIATASPRTIIIIALSTDPVPM